MSEHSDINQNIQDTEYAATSAKGDAVIYVYNYTYNYQNQEDKLVVSDEVDSKNHIPCPYRGLFSFSPKDAKFFFGRDVFIQELFVATKTNNFIPVLGASGSGKSSVVLAGLVPKLEQAGNWKFTHFRPGDQPFHALAKALLPLYQPNLNGTEQLKQSRQLAEYFIEGSVLLKDVFAQIESNYPNYRVLLIADQFEELFTLCPDDKVRQSFLDLLLTCFPTTPQNLQQAPVLVATMRADFLGNALAYRSLADILNKDVQLVGAMNPQELLEVIEKPAAILGVKFEPGLAERILDDVENQPGNLALLEFALTKLWDERDGALLTHAAYEKIGKVEGALAEYAEAEYQKLSKTEQEQARQIFLQLVNPGENNNHTRRRVYRQQIGEANWHLVTRKKGLADSRLVVTNRSSEDRETLEVVHEALIRHWTRLQAWLSQDRLNLDKQREIEDTALDWDKSGKKPDYLLSNKRLRSAKEFQAEQQANYPLSDLAKSFVANSKKQQRNQLIKSLGLFLIIPLIGTAIGGYFVVREINLNGDKKLIQDCIEKTHCAGRIQALERLVEAQRSLKSYNLSVANLVNANLKGAKLPVANLVNANLEGANLVNANLSDANLSDANLFYAALSSANLFHADLSGATLSRSNFVNANLSEANLSGVDLTNAALSGANLSDANLSEANLSGADLTNAALFDANLSRTDLSDAKFLMTYLPGANLSGANLSRTDLSRTDLSRTDLSDANLSDASLYGVDLSGANLYGTKLVNVTIHTLLNIKLACSWDKAIYVGEYNEEQNQWIVDDAANEQYIEELKQDKASYLEEMIDCSMWKQAS